MKEHQVAKYLQVIEWILFFCLCGLSVVFMNEVLYKFFSGKTSFTQSEESIRELPTIVICFSKPYSRKTQYEYGSDFKIKYEITVKNWHNKGIFLKEGTNSKVFGENLSLEKILTKYHGNCFR